MNIKIRDHFIQQWKKYFNNADLPVTFYYTDNPENARQATTSDEWNCLICELKKVRGGESMAFISETIKCSGAKRYLGFARQNASKL